jgi:hypothetical protein
MSAHTFRQRDALARIRPTVQEVRTVRPAAPWWLWAILTASVAVVLAARIMEVL